MGTHYQLTIPLPDVAAVDAGGLRDVVEHRLFSVNASMSTYQKDSEISRFNGLDTGECLSVSSAFLSVLQLATTIHALSDGALDVTIAPLVNRWGFGPTEADSTLPDSDEVAELLTRTGLQNIAINAVEGELCKRAAVSLDFSAVAKGYAVDQLAEELTLRGIDDFLIDIGGEVRVHGQRPGGGAWRLAIEKPQLARDGSVQAVLTLSGQAIATSGDYRNFRQIGEQRLQHTIDPRTGRPVEHATTSITVVAATAAEADAWATALNVLRPERARQLAEQYQLAVYMVWRDAEALSVWHSEAMSQYLVAGEAQLNMR